MCYMRRRKVSGLVHRLEIEGSFSLSLSHMPDGLLSGEHVECRTGSQESRMCSLIGCVVYSWSFECRACRVQNSCNMP